MKAQLRLLTLSVDQQGDSSKIHYVKYVLWEVKNKIKKICLYLLIGDLSRKSPAI